MNRDTFHQYQLAWNISAALRDFRRRGIRVCRARWSWQCPSCKRPVQSCDPLALFQPLGWVHIGCYSTTN